MSLMRTVHTQTGRAIGVAAAVAFIAPLLTRLMIGQAFYQTGGGKLNNLDRVAGFFGNLGIPFPELNAAFVAHLEYYGGMLLIVGLFTRLAALGLASTMAVALMTADREGLVAALSGSGNTGLTDVTPVVFGTFLVWLIVSGPGIVSLDALLWRWLDKRVEAEAGVPAEAAA